MFKIEEVKNNKVIKVHFSDCSKKRAINEYSKVVNLFKMPDGSNKQLSEINLVEDGEVIHSTKVISPLW